MRLVLLRHALAEDRYTFHSGKERVPDCERTLSKEGVSKMEQGAQGLIRLLDGDIQRIVSSPYVRARQTAQIIVDAMPGRRRPELELSDLLSPGCSYKRIRKWLTGEAGTVILVGHEPDMSWLMEQFCGSQDSINAKFGKAGACMIRFKGEVGSSFGVLQWLASPATLRMLGGS